MWPVFEQTKDVTFFTICTFRFHWERGNDDVFMYLIPSCFQWFYIPIYFYFIIVVKYVSIYTETDRQIADEDLQSEWKKSSQKPGADFSTMCVA